MLTSAPALLLSSYLLRNTRGRRLRPEEFAQLLTADDKLTSEELTAQKICVSGHGSSQFPQKQQLQKSQASPFQQRWSDV